MLTGGMLTRAGRRWRLIAGFVTIAAMSMAIGETGYAQEELMIFAIYCGWEPCDLTAQGLRQGVVAGPVEEYDLANTEGPVAPYCVPATDPCGNAHYPPLPGFEGSAWVASSVFIDVGEDLCTGGENEPGYAVTRFVDVAYASGEVEPGVPLRAGHLWHRVTDLGECSDNNGYWRFYEAELAKPAG